MEKVRFRPKLESQEVKDLLEKLYELWDDPENESLQEEAFELLRQAKDQEEDLKKIVWALPLIRDQRWEEWKKSSIEDMDLLPVWIGYGLDLHDFPQFLEKLVILMYEYPSFNAYVKTIIKDTIDVNMFIDFLNGRRPYKAVNSVVGEIEVNGISVVADKLVDKLDEIIEFAYIDDDGEYNEEKMAKLKQEAYELLKIRFTWPNNQGVEEFTKTLAYHGWKLPVLKGVGNDDDKLLYAVRVPFNGFYRPVCPPDIDEDFLYSVSIEVPNIVKYPEIWDFINFWLEVLAETDEPFPQELIDVIQKHFDEKEDKEDKDDKD